MRALQLVVFLGVIGVVACQRGRGLCPEGMKVDTDRAGDANSLWCKGKEASVRRWIQLWGPGDKRQSCGFRAGKPDGTFHAWHKGGNKWLEGQYRGGAKAGLWTQWDKEGHRVAEGEYRDGRLVGGAPVGMVALCENQKP
jgi:hypothetical protein